MFEVGKKYRLKGVGIEPPVFTCEYVSKSGKAFMSHIDREGVEDAFTASCSDFWREYAEPKKVYFKDLAVGEKFKWVSPHKNWADYHTYMKVRPTAGVIAFGRHTVEQGVLDLKTGVISADKENLEVERVR